MTRKLVIMGLMLSLAMPMFVATSTKPAHALDWTQGPAPIQMKGPKKPKPPKDGGGGDPPRPRPTPGPKDGGSDLY